jgi:hypothetical protein
MLRVMFQALIARREAGTRPLQLEAQVRRYAPSRRPHLSTPPGCPHHRNELLRSAHRSRPWYPRHRRDSREQAPERKSVDLLNAQPRGFESRHYVPGSADRPRLSMFPQPRSGPGAATVTHATFKDKAEKKFTVPE